MNETTAHTPPLPPRLPGTSPLPNRLAAFGREYRPLDTAPTLATSVDTLLKHPARLVYELTQGQRARSLRSLLTVTMGALAVCGVIMGCFAGGHQIWAAALKVIAGTVGVAPVFRLLKPALGSGRQAVRVLCLWGTVTGFVGCEIYWLFSPFLCKPNFEPHVLPRMYGQGNFYEHVYHGIRSLLEAK